MSDGLTSDKAVLERVQNNCRALYKQRNEARAEVERLQRAIDAGLKSAEGCYWGCGEAIREALRDERDDEVSGSPGSQKGSQ